jgi:hypothetical protein
VLLSDYVNDVQEILHDSSASVWPIARVISRINEARLDAARDMHCIRQNVTGVQLIPNVEIYNLNGAVAGATVTAGGSNYGAGTTVPVTFSAAPAGGTTALATGILTGGALTSINMTRWGVGYNAVPTISVGGVGSGATASAVTLFQANPLSTTVGLPLAITKISFIWNSQRVQLRYANFTLFDAYFRSIVQTFAGPPGAFSHHQQQQIVYIQPPPDQLYLSEWDVVFMPSPLVAMTDNDTQIIDPWARAVQFGAAARLLLKLRNMGQAQAMEQQYATFVPHVISTSGGIRIPNIYNRNFQRRVMR